MDVKNDKTMFNIIPNMHSFDGVNKAFGLNIVDAGFHETPSMHVYGPAVRDYYLIHMVERGTGRFMVGDNTYQVGTGSAFVIYPDEVTTYSSDKDDPWSYFWLGIKGQGADVFFKQTITKRINVFPFDSSVLGDYRKLITGKEVDLNNFSLISLSLRVMNEMLKSTSGVAMIKKSAVEKALAFIHANYFRPFSVSDLADIVSLTRSHFTTQFTESEGYSPYEYILNYRLNKAAELLKSNQNITVEEVAYSTGFSYVQRFSEMFKKRFLVSPLKYRKTFI